MRDALVLLFLGGLLANCGAATNGRELPSGAPAPLDPATPSYSGEFVGHVDGRSGALTFEGAAPLLAMHGGKGVQTGTTLQAITVVADGVADSGPADTVEFQTIGQGWDVAGGCGGANRFCATVTLRSFFASQWLTNTYVEIQSLTPVSHNGANSVTPTLGLVDTYGLWSYGTVTASGSSSQMWVFNNPDSLSFTFRGRVMATPVVSRQHRYWRFRELMVTNSHTPRTCEIRWFDSGGVLRTPNSFSASFDTSSAAPFDGVTNYSDQGWIVSFAGSNQSLVADFGTPGRSMTKFQAFHSYTGGTRGANWDIGYSDDGSTWSSVGTFNYTTSINGATEAVNGSGGYYQFTWSESLN